MQDTRYARLKEAMAKKGIDTLVLMGLANKDPGITYLSGIDTDFTFLIYPKKGNPILMVPKMEHMKAKKFSIIKDVRKLEKPVFDLVAQTIIGKKRGRQAIGINKSVVTLNEFLALQKAMKAYRVRFTDMSKELGILRGIKDDIEIKAIRKACRLTDELFLQVIDGIRKKRLVTEQDVKKEMGLFAMKNDSELAFDPIIASGKNSAMPHYRYLEKRLAKGFCVIDFGIRYGGYCSDMTRTIYIGKPTDREIGLYNLLLEIQEETIAIAKQGMRCDKLHEHVNARLGKLASNFTHGLGHGFGLMIHEYPSLGPGSADVLEDGMVFTIEPGIYLKGFGMRIEDDVLLWKGKKEVLTRSEKKLICLQ